MTIGRPKGKPGRKHTAPNIIPALRDLFALQERTGMTDEALAMHAGYHGADIASWRGGKRVPRLRTLAEYAEVFGYEIRLVKKAPEVAR